MHESITKEVEVTEDDIRNGQIGDSTCCPLARAIKRAFGASYAGVGCETVIVSVGRETDMFGNLPDKAHTFRLNFDHGQPVEPFKFNLTLTPG